MLPVQVGAVDLTSGTEHHFREVDAVVVGVEDDGNGVGLGVWNRDDGIAIRLHRHSVQQPARREQQEVVSRVV